MPKRSIASAFILAAVCVGIGPASAGGPIVFSNLNNAPVQDDLPGSPQNYAPSFTLSQTTHVDEVDVYVWNNGKGLAADNDRITIEGGGRAIGAASLCGSYRVAGGGYLVWSFYPGEDVPAGTYTVTNYSAGSGGRWSHNSGSSGRGFVVIRSDVAPPPTLPGFPTYTAQQGNCATFRAGAAASNGQQLPASGAQQTPRPGTGNVQLTPRSSEWMVGQTLTYQVTMPLYSQLDRIELSWTSPKQPYQQMKVRLPYTVTAGDGVSLGSTYSVTLPADPCAAQLRRGEHVYVPVVLGVMRDPKDPAGLQTRGNLNCSAYWAAHPGD